MHLKKQILNETFCNRKYFSAIVLMPKPFCIVIFFFSSFLAEISGRFGTGSGFLGTWTTATDIKSISRNKF